METGFYKVLLNFTTISVSSFLYFNSTDHFRKNMTSAWIHVTACCNTFLPRPKSCLKRSFCFFWIPTWPALLSVCTTWSTCSGISHQPSTANHCLSPVSMRLDSSNTEDKVNKRGNQVTSRSEVTQGQLWEICSALCWNQEHCLRIMLLWLNKNHYAFYLTVSLWGTSKPATNDNNLCR